MIIMEIGLHATLFFLSNDIVHWCIKVYIWKSLILGFRFPIKKVCTKFMPNGLIIRYLFRICLKFILLFGMNSKQISYDEPVWHEFGTNFFYRDFLIRNL